MGYLKRCLLRLGVLWPAASWSHCACGHKHQSVGMKWATDWCYQVNCINNSSCIIAKHLEMFPSRRFDFPLQRQVRRSGSWTLTRCLCNLGPAFILVRMGSWWSHYAKTTPYIKLCKIYPLSLSNMVEEGEAIGNAEASVEGSCSSSSSSTQGCPPCESEAQWEVKQILFYLFILEQGLISTPCRH